MKLYFADHEKLNVFKLPETVAESFLFPYTPIDTNIDVFLNFYSKDGDWYFKNDKTIFVSEKQDRKISSYEINHASILGSTKDYYFFIYPYENLDYTDIKIEENCNISIGFGSNNNISFSELGLEKEATITFDKGLFYINSIDEKSHIYLNLRKVKDKTILNIGDTIFIDNLKITWMKSFIRVFNTTNSKAVFTGDLVVNHTPVIDNQKYLDYSSENNDLPLYRDENYFFYKPRLIPSYDENEVVIDNPPAKAEKEEVPFIFTIGASGTMVLFSFSNIYNAVSRYDSSQGLTFNVVFPIIQAVLMLTCSFLLPQILKVYVKKKNKKRDKLREEKYNEYLNDKKKEIDNLLNIQKQSILENNLSSYQCYDMILGNKNRLWDRTVNDNDFLTFRVGIGIIPAAVNVVAPKDNFTLDRDTLVQQAINLAKESKELKDIPVSVSLCENPVTSIMCSCNFRQPFMDGLLLQLFALQSPKELKVVFLTNKENEYKWNYLKMLPYFFSDDKSVRYFASSEDEAKIILKDIEQIYIERKTSNDSDSDSNDKDVDEKNDRKSPYKNFKPYYLIITDDYKSYSEINFINRLLQVSDNYGFSLLIFDSSMRYLPSVCNKYIYIDEKLSCIFEKNFNAQKQIKFAAEYFDNIDTYRYVRELSNIPIQTTNVNSSLPTSLSFLEMYQVGNIEQLGILNRWKQSNPISSLSCPIGVHPSGEIFKLDLHEKAHGPHGLIAGSTGSGKSEFIITYILSMAVNYHPDDVQFVLIDYKGGGLAGAFENREKGISIPHLAGTITNLDVSEMNRTLVSIESELKRRQMKFNEARDLLGESTVDIYKYQKYYKEGLLKEPIPHLFIISDEFAELKSQQPDFMDELISTARIGRSLGVHLVLATQKPSGVVNDQIWSNSKFKVCLKVQTRADSNEMLKRPEAASIKETGRFYLQVGYDELFEIGQSAWSGAPYVPCEKVVKKIDDSISFINNIGEVYKSSNNIVVSNGKVQMGEQLTNIVKYLCDLGNKNSITNKKLWLDSIPGDITLNYLNKKYKYSNELYQLNPVIGEYDVPSAQYQGLLRLNISKNGNTFIYGVPGSGKENLLTTIITSLCLCHTTNELNLYIIDYGSESLRKFNKFPQVGDIIISEEKEKLVNFYSMINSEIVRRKKLFADFSGSYKEYNDNNEKKLPNIVCIINGYESFQEVESNLADKFTNLYKDGPKFGIFFILASSLVSGMRSKITQMFNNIISLKLNDVTDYRYLIGAPRNLIPADYFGRGLIKLNEGTFEFQTAYISNPSSINASIKEIEKALNGSKIPKAPAVPVMPKYLTASKFKDYNITLDDFPVGITTKLSICKFDFLKYNITPVISSNISKHIGFIYGIVDIVKNMPDVKVRVIDVLKIFNQNKNVDVFNDDFETRLKQIKIEIINDSKKVKTNLFIIIGLGAFKNKIDSSLYKMFDEVFGTVRKNKKNVFIIADNYSEYKLLESDSWFRKSINSSYGIWLGDNVGTQMAIKMPNMLMNEKNIKFAQIGYISNEGNHTIMKYVIDKEPDSDEE